MINPCMLIIIVILKVVERPLIYARQTRMALQKYFFLGFLIRTIVETFLVIVISSIINLKTSESISYNKFWESFSLFLSYVTLLTCFLTPTILTLYIFKNKGNNLTKTSILSIIGTYYKDKH